VGCSLTLSLTSYRFDPRSCGGQVLRRYPAAQPVGPFHLLTTTNPNKEGMNPADAVAGAR